MTGTRTRRAALLFAGLGFALAAGSQLPTALAAGSGAKTIQLPSGAGKNVVHYSGHAPFNNDQDGLVYGQLGIDDPKNACGVSNTTLNSQQKIKVVVPSHVNPAYDVLIRFQIDWTPQVNEPLADMALYLYGPDQQLVSASDGSQAEEGINLTEAKGGVYDALVCAFQTGPTGQDFKGTVTAALIKPPAYPRATGVHPATFHQFTAPKAKANFAGEPSIGNSWKTGHTFYTANTSEYDVAFNDKAGTATWKTVNDKVTGTTANQISLDPIGFTDATTGRTFVSQLLFVTSGAVYTDDDFKSVHQSTGGGTGINGFDHQTFGAGPYPKGMHGGSYPHAVYYCSQAQALFLGDAACSRSDNGGTYFGSPVSLWHGHCNGLHGHVRVGPDGTVYLPDNNCGGKQGMGVSRDAGKTWTIRQVPDSIAGESDPSVAAAKDNTVYYGYCDGAGKPKIAISRNHGASWTRSVDIGEGVGVHNCEFAEVMAGDGNRAAFAFLGTKSRGSTQAASFGKNKAGTKFIGARWDLYVATTYDRGKTWTTVDATPSDPVQRGCVWNSGGSNDCRNLLDFNDITIDKYGRIMVAIADGCVGPAIDAKSNCVKSTLVTANGLTQQGAILRQESGKGLFAKYDGRLPASGAVAGTTTGNSGSTGSSSGSSGSSGTSADNTSAATGSSPLLPALGVVLLAAAVLLGRARHRHHRHPA